MRKPDDDVLFNAHPVVLIDADERSCAETCAILESDGHEVIAVSSATGLAHALVALVNLLVVDVSAHATFDEARAFLSSIREVTADCWPVLLVGARPPGELDRLAEVASAFWTLESRDDIRALVRRILPRDEVRRSSRVSGVRGRPRASDRVLVVDDSETALLLIQAGLRASGFDVRIAMALAEVDVLIRTWSPDLVVVDVNMPEIQGDELCSQLKARIGRSDLRVVLCSDLAPSELEPLAQTARADAAVCKSEGLERLAEVVRDVLTGSNAPLSSNAAVSPR